MSRADNQFTIEVLYELGASIDYVPLADALLLLQSGSVLDTALRLAHDVNGAAYQQHVRNQALTAAANDLRARLTEIEDRLRRVA